MIIRDSGPKLFEEDISEFEKEHHVAFPQDYRLFMLECNGGRPFPDAFLAPNGNVEVTVSKILTLYYDEDAFGSVADLWRDPAWSGAIEAGFIQIATDFGGQRIMMKTKGENSGRIVIQIDGEYFFAASSFKDFLSRLEKYDGFEKDILYRIKEEAILAKPEKERGYVYHIPS
jgi:hypothetical protein